MDIDPADVKFWNYLVEHNTPVSVERLAKYFLVSKSHAGRALRVFAEKGFVEVTKNGANKLYRPTPENRTKLLRVKSTPVSERMANPFHTPAERVLLARFFKKLAKIERRKAIDDLPEAPF